MKKLFYYFLIATLAFNFVGCSDKDKDLDDVIDELEDGDDEDIVGKYIEYDGCTYHLENNKVVLSVGGIMNYKTALFNYVTGDFVVPQTISDKSKTYTVTEIGNSAFLSNKELISLTLHDKIEHIGGGINPTTLNKSFKKLIIGKGIKSFDMFTPYEDYITIIYATTPPEFKTVFDESTVTTNAALIQRYKLKLYVPSESIEAYKAHVYFKYYDIHSIDELEE